MPGSGELKLQNISMNIHRISMSFHVSIILRSNSKKASFIIKSETARVSFRSYKAHLGSLLNGDISVILDTFVWLLPSTLDTLQINAVVDPYIDYE